MGTRKVLLFLDLTISFASTSLLECFGKVRIGCQKKKKVTGFMEPLDLEKEIFISLSVYLSIRYFIFPSVLLNISSFRVAGDVNGNCLEASSKERTSVES